MPISTNAPFNEFGQSQILRDIEQLYLALNGAGSGGPGDGQTQDQTAATSQESGGLPDLSNLATIPYVDAAIAAIPGVTYPISIANGGTAGTTLTQARTNLALNVLASGASGYTYSGVEELYTVPLLCRRLTVFMIGGGGGGGSNNTSTLGWIAPSSGSTATVQLYQTRYGGGGGSGCMLMLTFDTVGGESIIFRVGSNGDIGLAGQPTYIRVGTGYIYAGGGDRGQSYTNPLGGVGGTISTAGSGLSLFTNTFVHYAISAPGGNGWVSPESSAGNGAHGGAVCGFVHPIFSGLYASESGAGGYSNTAGAYGFLAFMPHVY